jgi:hypothetical protein
MAPSSCLDEFAIEETAMASKENVVRLTQHEPTLSQRKPTTAQRAWLIAGLEQAGGKLPLFDFQGQRINERTIKTCIDQGWAEPWFHNPIKPDWLVCKLTDPGRDAVR